MGDLTKRSRLEELGKSYLDFPQAAPEIVCAGCGTTLGDDAIRIQIDGRTAFRLCLGCCADVQDQLADLGLLVNQDTGAVVRVH